MAARTRASKSRVDVAHQQVRSDEPARPKIVPIGAVNDPAERHADQLAQAALAVAGSHTSDAAPFRAAAAVRRSGGDAQTSDLGVEAGALQRASSSGAPLAGATRDRMEQGFGRSFDGVRVHTGAAAAGLAADMDARAFTHGSDIFFGAGQYDPASAGGAEVLAHELAHTVQNGEGVHRYPATTASAPTKWAGETGDVKRPGGGVSGGVYIMISNKPNDPVKRAVAKPIFGANASGVEESGEQIVAGDRLLAELFGIKTPTSRIVKPGAEFDELVALCTPKQPKKDTLPEASQKFWKPLSEAQSFVVMSEVPSASSLGDMVEEAANDREAAKSLVTALLQPKFLQQLGTLMIADMVIGNNDRVTMALSTNLGNVMVSMQNGTGELYAIDTTAFLPKAIPPSTMKLQGNTSGRAYEEFDAGAGSTFDRIMTTIVTTMKDKTTGTDARPIWMMIDDNFKKHRGEYFKHFEAGWDNGLARAMALAGPNGKAHMDRGLGGIAGKLVNAEGMAMNAEYLAERATGADHDDAVSRPMAVNLSNWAKGFDRTSVLPDDGVLGPKFTTPSKQVLKADWVAPPKLAELPTIKRFKLDNFFKGGSPKDGEQFKQKITGAHAQVNTLLQDKKRGVIFKKSQPRDRNLLGHAMVDANAVVAGASHAVGSLKRVADASSELAKYQGLKFQGSEAAPVRELMKYFAGMPKYLEPRISAYAGPLGQAVEAVQKTDYLANGGSEVVATGQTIQTAMGRITELSDRIHAYDWANVAAKI